MHIFELICHTKLTAGASTELAHPSMSCAGHSNDLELCLVALHSGSVQILGNDLNLGDGKGWGVGT